jgi:GT2 family glycosyltransferase
MDDPCITIGVPVYKGSDVLGDTLHSIEQQSYRNFRVNISIDGADESARIACSPFLRDYRFNVVSHNQLLGWAGNVNWLFTNARTEYFCYYPQDDVTESIYLEALLAEAARRPAASVVYSDIKFFENRDYWTFCDSIVGDPFTRVMTFLEILPFHAFRGLIRRRARSNAGLLRVNEYDSCMEDVVWLLKIARSGDMIRVPKTLYFKRWHDRFH